MSVLSALSAICRSPSWGAWIEINGRQWRPPPTQNVAPHRGERGLKSAARVPSRAAYSRSPSWGAWIEIWWGACAIKSLPRRSPSWGAWIEMCHAKPIITCPAASLPLVGSVD